MCIIRHCCCNVLSLDSRRMVDTARFHVCSCIAKLDVVPMLIGQLHRYLVCRKSLNIFSET